MQQVTAQLDAMVPPAEVADDFRVVSEVMHAVSDEAQTGDPNSPEYEERVIGAGDARSEEMTAAEQGLQEWSDANCPPVEG